MYEIINWLNIYFPHQPLLKEETLDLLSMEMSLSLKSRFKLPFHNGGFVEFCCVGGFSVQLKSRIVSLKLNTLLK